MGVFARFAVVPPQTVRLDLGDDHWVEVKSELNYGEMQAVASASRGDYTTQPQHLVAAYLVDWSLTNADGTPIPIDREADKVAALRALSLAHFAAINEAITAHVSAVEAAKKPEARSGRRKSGRT